MFEMGIKPDVITFADTGAERPHTYSHIVAMNNWLMSVGFPQIVVVRKQYRDGSEADIYDHHFDRSMLPSIAYGYKKCSQKFKIAPQDKYMNSIPECKEIWKSGGKVKKAIGYEYGEQRRAKIQDDKKYEYWYPLIEWGWTREDCVAAIDRARLKRPGKSSCFFCPNMHKSEIIEQDAMYPDLSRKIIALESKVLEDPFRYVEVDVWVNQETGEMSHMERDGYELATVKQKTTKSIVGLGRKWQWSDLLNQGDMFGFCDTGTGNCDCYDGD